MALTISIEGLVTRAVDHIQCNRYSDAGKSLKSLLLSLDQGTDFNLHVLHLLDQSGLLLAMGLIHYVVVTRRLTWAQLHEAVMRAEAQRGAGMSAQRH